jgi:hypothetical protein
MRLPPSYALLDFAQPAIQRQAEQDKGDDDQQAIEQAAGIAEDSDIDKSAHR